VPIERVGIVGSGIMGAGISEVAARHGFEVVLRSRHQRSADDTLEALRTSLQRQVDRGRLDAGDAEMALARVSATDDLDDLAACGLVLESVVEDLGVKVELFRALDAICRPETILATNTSTLPVGELALATSRPDRVCGVHFFNPATTMNLVEVVRPVTASDATIAEATAFAESCGKTTVQVADRAGFVVNALLFPYLNAAVRMLEAGTASRDDIDAAMSHGCNHPMGPLALLDLVGLDTSLAILEALHADRPDPANEPAPLLRTLVSEGNLGKKTGRGFYDHGTERDVDAAR